MAATTLQDVIEELQARISSVAGIRFAPAFAPDAIGGFPAAVIYPRMGTWTPNDATFVTGLHTIVIEVHVARNDLANAIEAAMTFSDSIPLALMADLASYAALRSYRQIRYEAGPMKWNDVDTWGWRFFLEDVKTQTALT